MANLFFLRAEEKRIKRDGGNEVDEEPALEVVRCNLLGVGNHLVIFINVGGAKVDDDVTDKHNVYHYVHCTQNGPMTWRSAVRMSAVEAL